MRIKRGMFKRPSVDIHLYPKLRNTAFINTTRSSAGMLLWASNCRGSGMLQEDMICESTGGSAVRQPVVDLGSH